MVARRIVVACATVLCFASQVGATDSIAQTGPTYLSSWDNYLIPLGILTDTQCNSYVINQYGMIAKYDANGALLTTILPEPVSTTFEGYGLGFASDGSILATQANGPKVRRYSQAGALIAEWPTDSYVTYLAVDQFDNVYVTEPVLNKVRKFALNGTLLTEWAVQDPTGICLSGGFVYVAGHSTALVSRFLPDGAPAGTFSTGADKADQLAADTAGNLYLGHAGDGELQCFTSTGALLWTLGPVIAGYSPDHPVRMTCVAVCADGVVLAGDYYNQRVLKFAPLATAARRQSWGRVKALYR